MQNSQKVGCCVVFCQSRFSHHLDTFCSYFRFYFLFQLFLFSLGHAAPDTAEKSDSNNEIIETLTTAESIKSHMTNGHGGPSMSIVKLFKKVSDRDQEKDQEILINLIEKSKESKQKVENYVTKKPSSKKPRKLKHVKSKQVGEEMHKIRHKRKKLIDKLKKRRKPSHMQVICSRILKLMFET